MSDEQPRPGWHIGHDLWLLVGMLIGAVILPSLL